jgi:predicted nuclease of predicted toxin-antitoxin system
MSRTIRFHLDENVDPRVAAGLRRAGIDGTTTLEAGLLSTADDEQLDYVVCEDRVMVTQDTDFLWLHSGGHGHPGITFYAAGSRSVGDVIRAVRLIWELLEPADMANQVEYI